MSKSNCYTNTLGPTFFSNISHELITPINSIIGLTNILLENEQKNEEQLYRFLKSINLNARRIDELLTNILDYSKINCKEYNILYDTFSVNDMFEELYDIFISINYEKNLNFVKLEFIKNEDELIVSDFLKLKQVLFNIISNSIKFTENGYIKISFKILDNFIEFKIEDTGIGIPNDKINFIFDKFYQCDSSSTKKYKGIGLGLYNSKNIIDILKGEILVESILCKGTTCLIKIPVKI